MWCKKIHRKGWKEWNRRWLAKGGSTAELAASRSLPRLLDAGLRCVHVHLRKRRGSCVSKRAHMEPSSHRPCSSLPLLSPPPSCSCCFTSPPAIIGDGAPRRFAEAVKKRSHHAKHFHHEQHQQRKQRPLSILQSRFVSVLAFRGFVPGLRCPPPPLVCLWCCLI